MTRRVAALRELTAGAAALALALALAAPLSLALSVSVDAQVATGTILGNVKDNSGGAVPGASVTATNVDTQFSRTTTTDAEGQYALPLLPLGNYKVEVALTASRTSRRPASCSKSAATRASTPRSSPARCRKSCRSSPTRRSSRPTPRRSRAPSVRTKC